MRISGARRTAAIVVATIASAATLVAGAAAGGAGAVVAAGPWFGAPTVGACTTLTPDQAAAAVDRSTVVDCSQAHSAKVAAVVHLPDRVTYDASGAHRLYRVVSHRCHAYIDPMLGRTNAVRDSSAYSWVWFVPTRAQRDHGARWASCSIVLRHGYRLSDLPTDAAPMLPSGPLGPGLRRCLLARTDGVYPTRCSAAHGWRATGTFSIAATTFPGARVIDDKALARCPARVITGRTFRWTYQQRADWEAAPDHVVVCFSKTSN